ncbi:hypothetical protein ABJI51_15890 [Amycolatopsis sp. NEAU-NG30]|uniref:Uncharacterized protein n=1 Tax=Amycolatopsis melonis TaxID=3156488 RepID=A0ABV0LE48_9PSEU
MSLPKKLAKIGGPVLALCLVAAAPVIGATSASADDGTQAVTVTPTPPPATTEGNPWHG